MNLEAIRYMIDRPNADPVAVSAACTHVLALRPETIAEHAETLYYYAEALVHLHQNDATAQAQQFAQRAYVMAMEAELPVVAAQAGCLALQRDTQVNRLTRDRFWGLYSELRENVRRLTTGMHLSPREASQISGSLFQLEQLGRSLEQSGRFEVA